MLQRFVPGVLGLLLCAAMASAQATMSITGGVVLNSGETIEISYSNPARANGTVIVVMDNGEFPLSTLEVIIHLDAAGRGRVEWVVPDWWWVSFNADGVREITRAIS